MIIILTLNAHVIPLKFFYLENYFLIKHESVSWISFEKLRIFHVLSILFITETTDEQSSSNLMQII